MYICIYIYIQLYTLEKSFLQVGKCGLETPNVLSKNLAKEVTSILRTWPWEKKIGYIPRMPQIQVLINIFTMSQVAMGVIGGLPQVQSHSRLAFSLIFS
jgi:hypothetical protein